MDKAPERIWATPDKSGVNPKWQMGWYHGHQNKNSSVEYTRTDISNALIAATLQAAKERVMRTASSEVGREKLALVYAANCIDGTFSTDARAAYDAAIRAAKIEGMREAEQAVTAQRLQNVELVAAFNQGIDTASEAITALIEETEKGGT